MLEAVYINFQLNAHIVNAAVLEAEGVSEREVLFGSPLNGECVRLFSPTVRRHSCRSGSRQPAPASTISFLDLHSSLL